MLSKYLLSNRHLHGTSTLFKKKAKKIWNINQTHTHTVTHCRCCMRVIWHQVKFLFYLYFIADEIDECPFISFKIYVHFSVRDMWYAKICFAFYSLSPLLLFVRNEVWIFIFGEHIRDVKMACDGIGKWFYKNSVATTTEAVTTLAKKRIYMWNDCT